MDRSIVQFLKRISFFLVYLPALVYGCQFAYFSGLTEPLGVSLASLGMNYFEVIFLGYLNLSIGFLENFNMLMWIILCLIIYLSVAALLLYFAIHSSERKNAKQKVQRTLNSFKSKLPKYSTSLEKHLNSFFSIIIIYFAIFMLSLALILSFYSTGKNQIEEYVQKIKESNQCESSTGYVNRDNTLHRTTQIVCGNNKCTGINLDKFEVITYLPEQYSKPIKIGEKKL